MILRTDQQSNNLPQKYLDESEECSTTLRNGLEVSFDLLSKEPYSSLSAEMTSLVGKHRIHRKYSKEYGSKVG
jgi:hypothetical protein